MRIGISVVVPFLNEATILRSRFSAR